jgi:hypothetical protein
LIRVETLAGWRDRVTSADVLTRAARLRAWQALGVSAESIEQIESKESIKKALHIRSHPEKVGHEVR